jgi:hypothetical protein
MNCGQYVAIRVPLLAAVLLIFAVAARADSVDERLFAAAEKGSVSLVAELLKQGAQVNAQDARGRTPVMAATLCAPGGSSGSAAERRRGRESARRDAHPGAPRGRRRASVVR